MVENVVPLPYTRKKAAGSIPGSSFSMMFSCSSGVYVGFLHYILTSQRVRSREMTTNEEEADVSYL